MRVFVYDAAQNTGQDLAYKYSSTPSVSNSKRFSKQKRSPTGFVIEHYAGSGKTINAAWLSQCQAQLFVFPALVQVGFTVFYGLQSVL